MAYKQAQNRHKKLVKTYEETKYNFVGSGVGFDNDRGFYYRYAISNTPGYTKMIRRVSNKKVRKSADIGNYGAYRKSYDYKWTIC